MGRNESNILNRNERGDEFGTKRKWEEGKIVECGSLGKQLHLVRRERQSYRFASPYASYTNSA